MRTRISGLALITLAASGCDWRVFDDLADETWARPHGGPSEVGDGNYGAAVAGAGETPGDNGGATYFATVRGSVDGVDWVRYDAAGTLTQRGDDVTARGAQALPDRPVLVGDRGSQYVFLATANPSGQRLYGYDSQTGAVELDIEANGLTEVSAMGFGDTDLDTDTATRDMIIGRGAELEVFENYTAGIVPVACAHGEALAYSIDAGDFGAATGDEVVVALGSAEMNTGPSKLVITRAQVLVDAAGASTTCFATVTPFEIPAPGGEPDFGFDLQVADINGGAADIIASAPSSGSVYVLLDVDADAETIGETVTISRDEGAFGESIAAGDLDGDGVDELAVGAHGAAPGGKANAGTVYLYDFTGAAAGEPIELHDASPETEQRFGFAVAIVPFGGENVLVVGTSVGREVFTYFRTLLYDDVRQ